MSLWYFYSIHGPGHQSHSDGFFELPDNATEKDAREHVDERMSEHNDWEYGCAVNHCWRVDVVSSEYQQEEIRGIKNTIKSLRRRIKELKGKLERKTVEASTSRGLDMGKDSEEYDREVMMALYGHRTEDLLKTLHQNGITVDYSRLYMWEYGNASPNPAIRDRVIACGKKTKRHLARSYRNRRWKTQTLEQWKKSRAKVVNFWIEMRKQAKVKAQA